MEEFILFKPEEYQSENPSENFYSFLTDNNMYIAQIMYNPSIKIKNLDTTLTSLNNGFVIGFQKKNCYFGEDAIFIFKSLVNLFYIETVYIRDLSKYKEYILQIEKLIKNRIFNSHHSSINLINIMRYTIYVYAPIYVNLNDTYLLITNKNKSSFHLTFKNRIKEYRKQLVF